MDDFNLLVNNFFVQRAIYEIHTADVPRAAAPGTRPVPKVTPRRHPRPRTKEQQLHLITIMAEVALVQALRNLTLPEPTTPSWVLTKRHFPQSPLSYTQLQQWVQMTIMKVSRVPPIMDYHALVSRQQVLHLLTNMEFIQDGTNS